MAALDRPKFASYEEHESVWVDTEDNEDHTFCGIMFPLRVKKYLPVEHIVLHSISVRGHLGDLTVHVSNNNTTADTDDGTNPPPMTEIPLQASHWTQIYQGHHKMVGRGGGGRRRTAGTTVGQSSSYAKLEFSPPLLLTPGQVRLLYVHSTHNGDESIVYDNSNTNGEPRYQDDFIAIHSGKAHLSPVLFGQAPIWGWGNAWRDRREFVGQLSYGVVYKLWNPEVHRLFGHNFSGAVHSMLCAQRRYPVGKLPDECLYYIMNMCKWDWFNDQSDQMKVKFRTRKRKAAVALMQEQERRQAEQLQNDNDPSGTAATTSTAVVAVAAAAPAAASALLVQHEDREAYERFHGYRADNRVFHLDEVYSSDEDDSQDGVSIEAAAAATGPQRQRGWFRRQFARINVLSRYHNHHYHSGSDEDEVEDSDNDSDDEDVSVNSSDSE